MTRRPTTTPLAAALQTASLLLLAAGVLGILISDVARNGSDLAQIEARSAAGVIAAAH